MKKEDLFYYFLTGHLQQNWQIGIHKLGDIKRRPKKTKKNPATTKKHFNTFSTQFYKRVIPRIQLQEIWKPNLYYFWRKKHRPST